MKQGHRLLQQLIDLDYSTAVVLAFVSLPVVEALSLFWPIFIIFFCLVPALVHCIFAPLPGLFLLNGPGTLNNAVDNNSRRRSSFSLWLEPFLLSRKAIIFEVNTITAASHFAALRHKRRARRPSSSGAASIVTAAVAADACLNWLLLLAIFYSAYLRFALRARCSLPDGVIIISSAAAATSPCHQVPLLLLLLDHLPSLQPFVHVRPPKNTAISARCRILNNPSHFFHPF